MSNWDDIEWGNKPDYLKKQKEKDWKRKVQGHFMPDKKEPKEIKLAPRKTAPSSDSTFSNLITEYEEHRGFRLQPEQVRALEMISNSKKNFIFTAPTGFGKTVIPDFLAHSGRNFVYCGPLKSLANEMLNTFSGSTKTARDTGDDFKNRQSREWWTKIKKSKAIVATYERLDSILRKKTRDIQLANKEFMIIDEIHMIQNKSRGHVIEGLIVKMRKLKPNIRIIGLSATLVNAKSVAEWLDAEYVIVPEERRPVPLEFKYPHPIMKGSTGQETEQKQKQLQTYFNRSKGLTGIVFCSSRQRAEQLARWWGGFTKRTNPLKMLKLGISYHHAGLTVRQKERVEQAFRDGTIKIMFTTTTFAMGVNLPADVCYFFDLSRWDPKVSERVYYEPDEVLQIAGRAGRRISPSGKGVCVLFGHGGELDFARDAIENPRGAVSHFHNHLVEKILEWVTTNIANDEEMIVKIAKTSLSWFQHFMTENQIIHALERLLFYNFVRKSESGYISASKYGEMTCKLYMNPNTIIQVVDNFKLLYDKPDEVSHKTTYLAALLTDEMVEGVAIRNMDQELMKVAQVYMDLRMPDELAKLTGYIFSTQIKERWAHMKVFISKGDKYGLKMQSVRMVDCLAVILPLAADLERHRISIQRLMNDVSLMIKYEDFEIRKLDILRERHQKRRRRK